MLKRLVLLFFSITVFSLTHQSSADITIKELIFSNEKPFHLMLLDTLPNKAKIQYGPEEAENTIIEFMDYFCGYCKKIHTELMEITEEADVKLYFFQFPVLSKTSKLYARTVLAVALQNINKALDVHHSMMTVSGSLTENKVSDILKRTDVNLNQFAIDMQGVELDEMLEVSYFLAKKIGGKGTPTLVINNQVVPGYIPKNTILDMLK